MELLKYLFSKMSSTEGYKALFKGGVTLSVLFLIATMQVSELTLPFEKNANELWYKIESINGKTVKSIDDLKCDIKNKTTYSDCKMAKYQKKISSTSVITLMEFQNLIKYLVFTLFICSIVGFIINPLIHKATEE